MRDFVKIVVEDPKSNRKKRFRREVLAGDDLHGKSGKWNYKERIIDRDNKRYLEKVTDPDTGELIHCCDESLRDHVNHGWARQKALRTKQKK